MSKTYRKTNWPLRLCKNCNKPLYRYGSQTVDYGNSTCTCWDNNVVRKVGYNDKDRGFRTYSYYEYENFWSSFALPFQYVYDYKVWDGGQFRSDCRKEFQKIRNKSYRKQVKNVINDRRKDWDEKIYPVVKKEVNADVW